MGYVFSVMTYFSMNSSQIAQISRVTCLTSPGDFPAVHAPDLPHIYRSFFRRFLFIRGVGVWDGGGVGGWEAGRVGGTPVQQTRSDQASFFQNFFKVTPSTITSAKQDQIQKTISIVEPSAR
jgi:hypothetical protein